MSGLESYKEAQFPIKEKSSANFDSAVKAAEFCFQQGQFEIAKEKYLKALRYEHQEGPVLFNVYKNMGNIDLNLGDLDSAEENYNRAFAINEHSDILMVNYGSLAILRHDLSKAVQCFRRAVELNNQNSKAWVGLASIHREFGDHELAWANAERAIDIDPDMQVVAHLMLDWAFRDNEIERAIRSISIYCRYKPKDYEMKTALAKLRYLMGRLHEAEQDLMDVLKQQPDFKEAEELFQIVQSEQKHRSTRVR